MAYETIIAAFASAGAANAAIRAARALGVPAGDIRQHPAELGDAKTARAAVEQDSGIWAWLFGRTISAAESAVYEKAVECGGTVVSISLIEEEAERLRQLLRSFEPLSLETR